MKLKINQMQQENDLMIKEMNRMQDINKNLLK